MAKLVIDVTSKNINSTEKQVTELDKATEKLRLENLKLNKELKSLDKTTADYTKEEKRLTKEIDKNTTAVRANNRQTKELDKNITNTSKSMSLQTKVLGGLAVAYSALQLKDLAVGVVNVGRQFEALTVSLNASVGGAVQGADAFGFLRQEANRLGTDLVASTKGFKELSASAKGTGINSLEVRDIFQSVSEAGAVMQLTTDDLNGTFRALSQIMSKGTVQAEELRGQLGERIPGAFQIASRAMGVTTQELGKMLEQGEVIADDFLPRFADELEKTFGKDVLNSTKTLTASINRFGNQLKLLKSSIAEAGLNELTQTFTDVGTSFLKTLTEIANAQKTIGQLKGIDDLTERLNRLKKEQEDYNELVKAQPALALSYQASLSGVGSQIAKVERLIREERKKISIAEEESIAISEEQRKKSEKVKADNQKAEQEKRLSDSLQLWKEYYIARGDLTKAFEIEEGEIRKQFKSFEESKIEELIAIRKEKYFDVLQEETIDLIESEYDEREKREKQLADVKKKNADKEKKDADKLEKNLLTNQRNLISGYGDLAGAIGGVFKDGSKEASAFATVQSALATVNAVNAVLTQGQGDPYTAPARIGAMVATVAGLLSNIGQTISIGNTSTSTSYDALSAQKANTGTGTTLGDSTQISKSISSSLEILEDFAKPEFDLLSSMNKSLNSINQKMGGVANLLIKEAGFAVGEGVFSQSQGFDNALGNNLATGLATGGIGLLLNEIKIPVLSDISNALGSVLNSVLGGLFGRTSSSSELADAGLIFGEQLLTQALEDFQGSAFQTIKTTVTKKSWFSKSTSTSYTTSLQDLNQETERQFGLVLNSLFDTVVKAGEALGSTESKIETDLNDFYVNIGKISLKDKSGNEIQETLEAVFGKLGDELAVKAFPIIENFQQIGEGLFETLSRVATGMQEAEFFTDRLGASFEKVALEDIVNTRGDVGFEALIQSIFKADSAVFGLNNGIVNLLENFTGTTSELFETFTKLQDVRTQFQFLGSDIDGITASLVRGAGSTNSLNSALNNFIKGFFTAEEQLELNLNRLDKEFAKLNLSVPNTKDEFKELLLGIDLTTEAGQELYGRLVLLADTFADVAEEADGAIDKLNRKLKPFFNTLQDSLSSAFNSFINLGNKAQNALSNLTSGANQSQFQTLTNFNQLLADFNKSKQTTDFAQTEGLYNQLIGVASGLGQDSTYTEAVRGFLSGNIQDFDAQKDILRVNIVDGLQELLGLNQEQTSSLKQSVQDGEITNQELASIQGLTVEQKDGIIETANNSTLFSTEKTLSSLEELSKLQLEDLRKAREEESEALSSKTFQFGDTIGTQEQKDISSLLGTEFANVSPLISSLQGLDVSQDRTTDLKNILGFTGTSINEGVFSSIQKLSPFLGGIGAEAELIKTEAEKNSFNNRLNSAVSSVATATQIFSQSKNTADYWKSLVDAGVVKDDNYTTGTKATFGGDRNALTSGRIKEYGKAFNSAYQNYTNLESLKDKLSLLQKEKTEKGFANGGFTGVGGKYEVAGTVHKGEYVVNQEQLRSVGGVSGMESMLKNGNKALIEANENLVQINMRLLERVNDLTRMFKRVSQNGRILSVSLDE